VEPVNLSDLVREMSHVLQASIPKNTHLQLDIEPNLPPVEADAEQLQRVVMNLVINGAEAIADGESGTVSVRTGVQQVDHDYVRQHFAAGELRPGCHAFLEVHDTGAGMDEATKARVFDPFFTTKFTGRGLGLAAVRGIVHLHKGGLQVYSAPGRGSIFKVLFPTAGESC
jgi:signal transduction histidine kinase